VNTLVCRYISEKLSGIMVRIVLYPHGRTLVYTAVITAPQLCSCKVGLIHRSIIVLRVLRHQFIIRPIVRLTFLQLIVDIQADSGGYLLNVVGSRQAYNHFCHLTLDESNSLNPRRCRTKCIYDISNPYLM